MPQRTTEEAVKALCPTDLTDISGPMRAGSLQIDRVYSDTNDEHTELIERYVVAHYVALLDPRERSVGSAVGGLRVVYEGRMQTEGLTTYLKTAMQLDTTGKLAQNMMDVKAARLEIF